MSSNRWIGPARFGALALVVSLAGCVVVPADPYYGGGTVAVAPPPPRAEVVGVAPYPGWIWLGGYWNWTGRRHEWVGGHWDAPRHGHRWVPHHWSQHRDGWRFNRGYWHRGR